jgi:3-oxoacyl-[acyl-carrier protein] reductase
MSILSDKVAVISGASRGLGAAITEDFLNHGARVACFSRKRSPQIESFETGHYSKNFFYREADMLDRSSLREFAKAARRKFSTFDILVNNAGVAYDHVLPLSQDKGIDDTLTVNLTNTIFLTRECLKPMWVKKAGTIINISSILGLRGYSGLSVYGASKAGLLGFTLSLAREVGKLGIRVNAVCPGYTETNMTAEMSDSQKEQIIRRTPLGRLARVADVIPAVRFLASDEAGFITGQILAVDGGIIC